METRQLVGLDRGGLGQLLGKPALLRREASAEVWQYAAKGCVLHIFLYRDGAANSLADPYRVVYVDAVRRGHADTLRPAAALSAPSRTTLRDRCLGRLLHKLTTANKTS